MSSISESFTKLISLLILYQILNNKFFEFSYSSIGYSSSFSFCERIESFHLLLFSFFKYSFKKYSFLSWRIKSLAIYKIIIFPRIELEISYK